MMPRATYRLQFRAGMDFQRAAGIVPYLARLGISHLYASPVFQAMPGSSHGYDVTDHNRLDDALGGMEGFGGLSRALEAHGMGLILDIVPNHMAASVHNPWWRDVLCHGRHSTYAGHFDIDWSAPRLLLPVLGGPYGAALDAGELALGYDADGLTLHYHEHAFPLDPRSWDLVSVPAGIALPEAGPFEAPKAFALWVAEPWNAGQLDERLRVLSGDHDILHRIHEAQPWRLAHWRAARDALTYRRFFEIADLVGVRVEEDHVFDDVHRLVFEMLEAGQVRGLRIDHIDGLADPSGYLARLKQTAPGRPPIWVEKILGAEEKLRGDWPVEGTTGYEFARLVGGLLTNPDGAAGLTRAYHDVIGRARDRDAMLADAKREILTWNLAAELDRLTELCRQAAAADPVARDLGRDTLRRALIAIAVALPVYRSYLSPDGGDDADAALLEEVGHAAAATADLESPAAVRDVLRLIRGAGGEVGGRLRACFQQTTGALMAKAVEDTLFYRYNRLLSANEVGGQPDPLGIEPAGLARAVAARAERQPHGLNATATHDTKRGEDARARIAAIAESPEAWYAAVRAWDDILLQGDTPAPGAETRWVYYQAQLGAWEPHDSALAERMVAYLVKAAREAKTWTRWTRPDAAYETMLRDFAEGALSSTRFVESFEERARPFIIAGERKGLVQLALKLVLPGIPDIYQGTEWADLSLVDPDNRRPVDFAARSAALDAPAADDGSYDRRKMGLLAHILALRRQEPELFEKGSCEWLDPVPVPSGRYVGFSRAQGRDVVLVLCELSAGEPDSAPGFPLPPALRKAEFAPVFPNTGLERFDGRVAPRGGFSRSPVVAAIGRTPGRAGN